MVKKSLKFKIEIKSIDPWASSWITLFLYRLVDKDEIETLQIKEVKKSKHSIDLLILISVGYGVATGIALGYGLTDLSITLRDKIIVKLRKWKEKRPQSRMTLFFDNKHHEI